MPNSKYYSDKTALKYRTINEKNATKTISFVMTLSSIICITQYQFDNYGFEFPGSPSIKSATASTICYENLVRNCSFKISCLIVNLILYILKSMCKQWCGKVSNLVVMSKARPIPRL